MDKPPLGIPGYDPRRDANGCMWDATTARNAIGFFTRYLTHVKGQLAGRAFELEPWQAAIIANLFGWRRADGTRRYREAFVFVPRKNGKSLMAAGICNYMLFCDGEPGAEIYCAAADRDQATLVFDVAKAQVLRNKDLSAASKVYRKSIVREDSTSSLKAISADADTKHGYNSHCVVLDELHAQRDRELVDVLLTSTGARLQPLVVYITTSDYQRPSICNEKYDYAIKVRDGVIDDPSFLPVIFEASLDDDWTAFSTWKKANPNLDVSISREYLERECKRAQESPAYENTFKRLHLNIRTEQDVRWLQMARWDECAGVVDVAALRGRTCFAGLDLSANKDITALVLVFPEGTPQEAHYQVLPFFWLPGKTALERQRNDRVPYLTWMQEGLIERAGEESIDQSVVLKRIVELTKTYTMGKIAYDPWNAEAIAAALDKEGLEVFKFAQSFSNLNAPAKELERLILSNRIAHGGHPVLRWMASNVTVVENDGNIRPSKKRSPEKIDGIIALCMALGLAMHTELNETIYNSRGLLTL